MRVSVWLPSLLECLPATGFTPRFSDLATGRLETSEIAGRKPVFAAFVGRLWVMLFIHAQ